MNSGRLCALMGSVSIVVLIAAAVTDGQQPLPPPAPVVQPPPPPAPQPPGPRPPAAQAPTAQTPAVQAPAAQSAAPRRPLARPDGLPTRPASPLQTTTMAVTGTPYGVARIELPLATTRGGRPLPVLEVSDDQGRILYPVTRDLFARPAPPPRQVEPPGAPAIGGGRLLRRLGNLVREINTDDSPVLVGREATFLFRGTEPLRVRLSAPDVAGRTELLLTPAPAPLPSTHRQLIDQWWAAYTSALLRQADSGDYPPLVESYLIALLSGRLDLPLPDDFLRDATGDDQASMWSTLELLAGNEAVRTSILRRAATGLDGPSDMAALPVPTAPRWQPMPIDNDTADVPVEATASRVPPECFYLRFGSFANYVWFRDLSEEYGGDIGRMVTLRGVENDSAGRLERQLCLRTTELSRILGESVIADQAIIGHDLFLNDGASLGVLFKAHNTFLLRRSLDSDRTAVVNGDESVTRSLEQIAGREVSLVASADNRVRSFLAIDGEYILVSNSRKLVERFFEVGDSGDSLSQTSEFRLARKLVPLDREDTVFAYFSPQMLTGLVEPEYLIEVRRRLRSAADMSMLRLARLAATAEGQPLREIDDLIDSGFLPLGFGTRPDGSGVLAIGDEIVDSLRGRAGTLLPISDVELTAVTAEEDRWYRRIAEYHGTRWQQMDPIVVGLRRSIPSDTAGVERLEVHAEIAPWDPEKYGTIAKQLGPPTKVRIDFAPDDIVAAQAHVVSDQLGGSIPPHHLFAAVKDTTPPDVAEFDGIFSTLGALRSIPGYIGAWPLPGLLDRLPLGLGRGQPVGPGMTRLVGGLYRFQGGGFSIVSFQPDVLQASLSHIVANESDDQAQLRISSTSLVDTRLEAWANEQLYRRAAAASRANAELLGMLTRQLKVEREDAVEVAGELLGARLQDPLGGTFELVDDAAPGTDHRRWASTAWGDGRLPESPPPGYLAPVLSWFRGGRANLTQFADRVVADAVIDVSRPGER